MTSTATIEEAEVDSEAIAHFDVLIVGAGLSGIGAAYHLQTNCPGKTYAIIEGREAMGGTWDLFKYPGIRSDSDMYTLGYAFKPWVEQKAIADGPAILKYINETASENGIAEHIKYGLHVDDLDWDSEEARWTLTANANNDDKETTQFSANFIFMCSGYYDYAGGHSPDFPGKDTFQGQLIHPQAWPEDLDYTDKKVVIIGSGATAVTLVPAMAETAKHVTMLQRSPTYVVARPAEDAIANKLRKFLPAKLAYAITRWKNVLMGMYFFNYTRKHPKKVADMLIGEVKKQLPDDYAVDKHFKPSYKPWDQRLCLVPDGDMFTAIREQRASVVTDQIATFTETGIELESGETLEADIVVSATGLKLQMLSGVSISIDGESKNLADSLTYKGMMFSDVPNLALSMGYTNASWTLKSDLTAEYVCRLINHMDKNGYVECCPRNDRDDLELMPFMDLNSGYVQRAMEQFPKQATEKPWCLNQNYAKDMFLLGFATVEDEAMEFRTDFEDLLVDDFKEAV